ncbi:MAG: carboxypeptidase-like regulatory domain-containing protein [bacterium]
MRILLMLLLLFGVTLLSCTSNPFSDDEISAPPQTVKGRVTLAADDSPAGAFIWLEEFNISTRTDDEGRFSLTLPRPAAQGTGSSISGVFSLYAYIANYKLAVRDMVVREGQFVFSPNELNTDGELAQEIQLSRLLTIHTDVVAVPFDSDPSSFLLRVAVTLQSPGATVPVYYPRAAGGVGSPVYMRNLQSHEVSIIATTIAGIARDSLEVDSMAQTRQMVALLSCADFPAGRYEIIPYLLVVNPEVPRQLIQSIAADAEMLGLTYLELPFARQGGLVEIKESVVCRDDGSPSSRQ